MPTNQKLKRLIIFTEKQHRPLVCARFKLITDSQFWMQCYIQQQSH